MYVKVKLDGSTVFPYTLSDFRAENPRTSFPSQISEETLNEHGVYLVEDSPVPDFNLLTHELKWELAQVSNTRWARQWVAVELPIKTASKRVRSARDRALSETDWCALSDVTISDEMRSYRQALRDITEQEGFPHSVSWPEKPE